MNAVRPPPIEEVELRAESRNLSVFIENATLIVAFERGMP